MALKMLSERVRRIEKVVALLPFMSKCDSFVEFESCDIELKTLSRGMMHEQVFARRRTESICALRSVLYARG